MPQDDSVATVALLNEPVRRAVFRYVTDQPDLVGRDEVAEACDVPRSVAAFHLDKLVEAGLLVAEFRRPPGRTGPGAGRPAKLYRRSEREFSVSVPERHYELAAALLARAVEDSLGGACELPVALRRAARAFGAQVGAQVASEIGAGEADRHTARAALLDALYERGYEPGDEGERIVVRNCPFHALARQHTALVCGLNLDLLQALAELVTAAHLRARLDPAPDRCCVVLEPEPPEPAAPEVAPERPPSG